MKCSFFLACALLSRCTVALSQQEPIQSVMSPGQAALTNDAIVKMVKAGIGEEVIVSMVNAQPANYTLTPETLIDMKSAGVPDRVVTAMVGKYSSSPQGFSGLFGGKPSGATPPAGTVSTGDPNDPITPHDSGIYLYGKNHTLIMLEETAYQGTKMGSIWGSAFTYGIKKMTMTAVIPRQHANISVPDGQIVFYFYFEDKAAGLGKGFFGAGTVSNPDQFALVKLEVIKSSRELTIGAFGAFGSSTGTEQKSMVSFKSERLKTGLYRVTTDGPLTAGEYCFLVSRFNMGAFGAGAAGANQIFDFAVNASALRLQDTLRTMGGREFEHWSASLFRRQGYAVQNTQATGDHGIDLILTRGGRTTAVLCRRWPDPVGEIILRDFYRSMMRAHVASGIVATTSTFTPSARAFVQNKPIRLIEIEELLDLGKGGLSSENVPDQQPELY